jgi:hypothetical protein
VKVLDREVFDIGGPSHVRAFLHVVLFPSVRLLVVHPQQTRSRTLTVAVTHPGTNAHNCSLTSSNDHTTIYPLGQWYSSKSKWLDTYCYSDSQLSSLCKPEWKKHSPNATLCVLYRTSDHTTIYPLGHWYLSKSKWLDTYRYLDSQLPSLCKPEWKLHSPKATLCVLYRTKLN